MAERSVPVGRPVVVVVDDERTACRATVELLERAGYDARGASSPAEADALIGAHVAALLLDVHLTLMRGDVFFHYVVARFPMLRARSIFVTSELSAPVRGIVAPTGCPVLVKPFARETLLAAVARVLESGDGGRAPGVRVSSRGGSSGRS